MAGLGIAEYRLKQDWIWGWIAAVPALGLAWVMLRSASFLPDSTWIAAASALAIAAIVSTSTLWVANRHSLSRLQREGGEVELIIRPGRAITKAVLLFPAVFSSCALLRFHIDAERIEWATVILLSAAVAYVLGLANTAYKNT